MQVNYCPCLMIKLPDEDIIHLVKNYESDNVGVTFCDKRGIVTAKSNAYPTCPECVSIMKKYNIRIL